MLRSLAGIGRVLATTWPALLAWYLGGVLVRVTVIALAASIGAETALGALVIVPIAALARLVSYVGMFLAVRRGMRTYREVAAGDIEFTSIRDAASEFLRVLLASIIPFFTLYAVLGLLAEDLSDYAQSAFRQSFQGSGVILNVGDGPVVATVIFVALGARIALKVFGSRLPRWLGILEVYFEATWIFVALTGISALFGDVIRWAESRQVVHWYENARDWVLSLGDGVRWLIAQLEWLAPVVLQLLALPLAWLLIAGIVYTRALANIEEGVVVPKKLAAAALSRFNRLPTIIRRQSYLLTDEWEDVGSPFTQAGKLIVQSGLRSIAIFLAAYGFLFAASRWLEFFVYRLIGAHDSWFWTAVNPVLDVGLDTLTEPLRVVLLAVAFDWCLTQWQERRHLADAGASVPDVIAVDTAHSAP
ncbi:MAG: hypothetical protein ACOH1T_06035 [Microbacteriaceae bacterium]